MKAKQKQDGPKGKAPPGGRGGSLPNPKIPKKGLRQTEVGKPYRPRPYSAEVRRRAVQPIRSS